MSNQEINSKVQELRELKRMQEELADEISALEDAIKAHMTSSNIDTLTTLDAKITWKVITSTRLDTAAFKKELPEIAERYLKTTTTRRFTVQ